MLRFPLLILLFAILITGPAKAQVAAAEEASVTGSAYEVVVESRTLSGFAAAFESARLGRKTLLILPYSPSESGVQGGIAMLKARTSGMCREWIDSLQAQYTSRFGPDSKQVHQLEERLGFETADLQALLVRMAGRLPNLTLRFETTFDFKGNGYVISEGRITQIRVLDARSGKEDWIAGRVFIDGGIEYGLVAALDSAHLSEVTASPDPSASRPLLWMHGVDGDRVLDFSELYSDRAINVLGIDYVPEVSEGETFSELEAVLGQALGATAAIALKQGVLPGEVEPRQVQAQLLEDGVSLFFLDDVPRTAGKAWAGAQLIALYYGFKEHRFEPTQVMPPRQFELWWPAIFPSRGMPGPIYQPANRRDAAETVGVFFRNTYLNPKPKAKVAAPGRKGRK